MTKRVVVALLAACGGGGGGAPKPETSNTAAAPTEASGRTDCPDQDAVKELAWKVWYPEAAEVVADPEHAEDPECAPFLRQGEALWLIGAYTLDDANGDQRRLLLVTPGGDVRWRRDVAVESHTIEKYSEDHFRGADLDGDGTDEVLGEAHSYRNGYISSQLLVSKLVDDKLVPIPGGELPLSDDNSGAVGDSPDLITCEGAVSLVPGDSGMLRIPVTYTGDCESADRTYELRDGTIVDRGAPASK